MDIKDISNVDIDVDYVTIYENPKGDMIIELPNKCGFYDMRIKAKQIVISRNMEIIDIKSYHNVIEIKPIMER